MDYINNIKHLLSTFFQLAALFIKLVNINISYENGLEKPGVKPGVLGQEARMLTTLLCWPLYLLFFISSKHKSTS